MPAAILTALRRPSPLISLTSALWSETPLEGRAPSRPNALRHAFGLGGPRPSKCRLVLRDGLREQIRRRAAEEVLHVGRGRLALDEDGVGHDGAVEGNRSLDAADQILAEG